MRRVAQLFNSVSVVRNQLRCSEYVGAATSTKNNKRVVQYEAVNLRVVSEFADVCRLASIAKNRFFILICLFLRVIIYLFTFSSYKNTAGGGPVALRIHFKLSFN